VNACDEVASPEDLHRRPAEPHLVAGVVREQHLVAGLDRARVRADGRDDAGAAVGLRARRDDQPEGRLRFLVGGLDDDVVVERLEGQIESARFVEHEANDTPVVRVGRHEVTISNPDKVFFPARGLTKGDLVRYYLDLAGCVLPHLRRRLFHMVRYPHGVHGDFFHQKRVPNHPAYVDEQFVRFPSGHSTVFAVIDNAAALAWVINLGCIELHTWHSRVNDIERPDYMLIDLDPTTDRQWPYVRAIALVVRDVLDELGLAAYPKTSGATGLHILTPIRPELRFPDVRRFAKRVAEEVERRVGDQEIATTTWRVAERRGVFVDFGQNARDRTIAAAYSVRPRPDARVSAPLRWDEVASVEPEAFTIETMRERIAATGDLTAGMWRRKASLRSRFAQLGLEEPEEVAAS
jgi:bifunctional non-homologous end joining protein LigD